MEKDAERRSVAEALFKTGALRFGRFTLSSGGSSSYYLDLRVIPSYPEVYSLVLKSYRKMLSELGSRGYDALAGVATAGVTISSPLAFVLRRPMIYVRKEEKGYGLGRQVEGAVKPGWRVVLIDDLVTTGASVISAIEAVRGLGCVVSDAVVLVDRLEGAQKNLREVGVELHSSFTIGELVTTLFERKKLTKRDRDAVMRQVKGGAG